MRIKDSYSSRQCQATVSPGEYINNLWAGEQCQERKPQWLARCERCQKLYCLTMHYHKHLTDCLPHD